MAVTSFWDALSWLTISSSGKFFAIKSGGAAVVKLWANADLTSFSFLPKVYTPVKTVAKLAVHTIFVTFAISKIIKTIFAQTSQRSFRKRNG